MGMHSSALAPRIQRAHRPPVPAFWPVPRSGRRLTVRRSTSRRPRCASSTSSASAPGVAPDTSDSTAWVCSHRLLVNSRAAISGLPVEASQTTLSSASPAPAPPASTTYFSQRQETRSSTAVQHPDNYKTHKAMGGPASEDLYGQFSKFHVCFCGLDPGNLKFETVRTNKQRICF